MTKTSAILDYSGRPYKLNGHKKRDLASLVQPTRKDRKVHARYDAATDSEEYEEYWANADKLDADSANSREVREKLVPRSRYEVGNNGFADGMVQTYSNYLVGVGPSLRMQTGNTGFNQVVELVWFQWQKEIKLRRKVWCMGHAKLQDGEALGLLIQNERLRHRIKLDIQLLETEMCQTPFPPLEARYIDGIKLDEFDNPEWYDILEFHPGATTTIESFFATVTRVLPEFVLHWFQLRRPGQHRGVPEFRSTLQLGAQFRRWREATIGAAETAASLGAALLKSTYPPSEDEEELEPLTSLPIRRKMMTTLPPGWEMQQMKGEHPNAEFSSFMRANVNEQARPKSIPYNLAACDSSSYNYASGRLDHQTFFSQIDVEREDGNDLVLDKVFDLWWSFAVEEYGWPRFGTVPAHTWDWPKHPVADQRSDALANDLKLKNGSTTIPRVYFDAGLDPADEAQAAADYFGIQVDEFKKRQLDAIYPPPKIEVGGGPKRPIADEDEREEQQ